MNRAIRVACPQCGAESGHACRGRRGRRLPSPHGSRVVIADRTLTVSEADRDRQEAQCRAFLANPHTRADDFWAAVA